MAELGNLKILNVTKDLLTATEDDFVFTVPPGGDGELREATYQLKRASPVLVGGLVANTCDPFTSEDVVIKSLEIVKRGASETTNLLSGTPNIKEFGGDGKLTRLFTIIETSENNEDIVIKVRNNDLVTVRVSLTLNLAVKTKKREISSSPPERA